MWNRYFIFSGLRCDDIAKTSELVKRVTLFMPLHDFGGAANFDGDATSGGVA